MSALAGDGLVWLVGPRLHRRFGLWINLLARILLQGTPENFVAQVRRDPRRVGRAALRARGHHGPHARHHRLAGSADAALGDAEELAELIPDSRLSELRGAAHGLMVEQPNAFNGAVLGFLADVDNGVANPGAGTGASAESAEASAGAVDEPFDQTA